MAVQPLHIRRFVAIVFFVLGVAFVGLIAFPPVTSSREHARHSQCINNLKLIGLALHQYHDDFGSFPPAYIADEQGRAIHSWRTLILPYLDQPALFNEYRFDEPWDGPHNAEICKRFPSGAMPFSCPADPNYGRAQTNYLAVVGPNTAWPGPRPAKREDDFPDGLSSTILVVEVENSGIHWMEPRDLDFAEMSFRLNDPAGTSISSRHKVAGNWPWSRTIASVHVLFADGSVKRLPLDTTPETIRATLTAIGGEKVETPP